MLYDHALHFIYIFTMFHAFRCVFICWKLCADRFRLGWTHDAIIFSTSHSFHAYVPFLFYLSVLGCDCVMFFFSLSLSDRLHIAPKHKSTLVRNPLHFGSSSSDPHVPPPFTFGSVMKRPIRTSRRTFLNVAFMWFYQNFLIPLFLMSLTLRDENLFVRYPWGVPPCSYKSFTLMCIVSIPLCLSLSRYLEVHIS